MAHDIPIPSARSLYDDTASRWVRTQPTSLSDFTARPAVLSLCQPVRGLRVLDLGCGEGYCARQLMQDGALEVLGIDISQRMIDAAVEQERRQPLGIRYLQGDASHLSEIAQGDFDLVLAVFLFNYLSVEDTRRCMAEVARVVKPGGRFVFAVPHPSMGCLRRPEPPFYFDMGGAGYFSGRDRRFSGRIYKRDGGHLDVQMCHKTVEDYFAALSSAGFRSLPIVRELCVTPEILSIDPHFFGPLIDVPLHLALAIER